MAHYGPAVLRAALGVVFAAHGSRKLFGLWGGGGLPQTAASLSAIGADRWVASAFGSLGLDPGQGAMALAVAVALLEFTGGLLLLSGFATRWVSALLVIETGVAALKVHLPHGFFLNWTNAPGAGHGVEMALVLAGGLVCLLLTGAGALSIDARREASAEAAARGRARLRWKH